MTLRLFIGLSIQLISALLGLYTWRRLHWPYKIIVVQVLVAILFQLAGWYLSSILRQENSWLFNIYLIVEMVLLGVAGIGLMKNKRLKRYGGALLGTLVIFWLINLYRYNVFALFNWFFISSALLLVLLYTSLLFDSVVFSAAKLLNEPIFFICLSTIIYFASIIPLFGLLNNLIETDNVNAGKLYVINHMLNFLRYSLVAIAFYLYARQAKKAYVR